MRKNVYWVAGLVTLLIFSGYSFLQAGEEEVREIVLSSRVELGAKIWAPPKIFAKKGEKIKIRLENHTEVIHGFAIDQFKVREQVFGGQEHEFTFKVGKKGTFRYYCFIHKAHKGGELIVE